MIIGLHHVSLAYSDLELGIRTYSELLGRKPSARSQENGAECAYFVLANSALRIVSPSKESAAAAPIRQMLETKDGVLFELGFQVEDINRTWQLLSKISLSSGDVQTFETADLLHPGGTLRWRTLEFDNRLSHGVNIRFVQPLTVLPVSKSFTESPLLRTELLVIQTGDPERALGLYAARFHLKLLFDRTNVDTGNRLVQLACGDLLLELSHSGVKNSPSKPDHIWGIGWSVAHAEAAQARLSNTGRNVSSVKDGAQPGTRVFTIRDGTCGVPTLVVEHI
ncbi:VOC family protein [Bradyrhizobium sp. Arg68]|uniref:VOC family protein n=1 Tax=Bradyrhizobium ivorense TaxID=2511166 RepID=UPI001E35EBA4|nr:VOC family protein [Bradyrhizobium ivorense]MCC8936592.1 VOC family protein [Bradyrhizobium ivorense]